MLGLVYKHVCFFVGREIIAFICVYARASVEISEFLGERFVLKAQTSGNSLLNVNVFIPFLLNVMRALSLRYQTIIS